jgi:hypothetical protein
LAASNQPSFNKILNHILSLTIPEQNNSGQTVFACTNYAVEAQKPWQPNSCEIPAMDSGETSFLGSKKSLAFFFGLFRFEATCF